MDKLRWCAGKKDGLRLVEPSANLADAYVRKAEGALESMRANVSNDWKIAMAYYTIYFSLYSVLAKIGVKSGIHACTIEFARRFLGGHFSDAEIEFVEESFKARIDAQYYVDRGVPDAQCHEMMDTAPEFLVKCKAVLVTLNEKRTNEIRAGFRKAGRARSPQG